MPKNRIRHSRKFQPGDSVLVYNTQTKVNSSGTVKDCKSNNSYIVTIDNCDKHISGDHMRLNCVDNNARLDNDHFSKNVESNIASNDSSDEDGYLSDNDSIVSDDSDDYIFPQISKNCGNVSNNVTNYVSRRKYRTENEKLKDSLTKDFPESRTRAGKNRNT